MNDWPFKKTFRNDLFKDYKGTRKGTPEELKPQFDEIEKQMIEHPELKTHFISPWIPQYTIRNSGHQQKVVVAPCHGLLAD